MIIMNQLDRLEFERKMKEIKREERLLFFALFFFIGMIIIPELVRILF